MDSLRAARYPFLRDAAEFSERQHVEIERLLSSDLYSDARERGAARVMGALENHEIPEGRPLMGQGQEYNRLMEVLSYVYARMLVSLVDDRLLTKRYALAEAERMASLLHGDRDAIPMVSEELEVNSLRNDGGTMSMHFADFLRYSYVMKAVEWKLINMDVRGGYVRLDPGRYDRLLQNAYRIRIESELPLKIPDELAGFFRKDVEKVAFALDEAKRRMSPTGGEAVKDECLPPCMRAIIAQAQAGQNLPHSARFALVSFLHALGMDYDQIVAVFAESPDFDESVSRYQIMHITGDLNGTEGYIPPECGTMKTNGICFDPDPLCERIRHPLNYYRIKSGNTCPRPDRKERTGPRRAGFPAGAFRSSPRRRRLIRTRLH